MKVGGERTTNRGTTDGVASNTEPDGREPLPKDTLFHLLQTKRRRDVVRFLSSVDSETELRELAEQVAAWEAGTSIEDLSSSQRQRVYISLYQTHLPKLDKHDVIDYDKDRGLVTRRDRADQFEPYLEISDRERTETDPWPLRYGVVVLLGLVLLGSETTFGLLSATWIALIVVGTFGAVTVAHSWDDGRIRF